MKFGLSATATVAAAFVGAACFGGGPVAANEIAAVDQESEVLSEFRAEIQGNLSDDPSASIELKKFDGLKEEQRSNLADYLLGETPAVEEDESESENEVTESTVYSPMPEVDSQSAAAGTKTVWGKQWIHIGGVKITETKVSGTYAVKGGKPSAIKSHSCTVVKNIDPFAKVSSSRNAAYTSGNSAVFECKVTVKRGAPTKWGPITWSTKQAVQQLKANGGGKVTSHGWK